MYIAPLIPTYFERVELISSDYLAMLTFALAIGHFGTEYAVWRTVGWGAGMAMAVGVPAVSLGWMASALWDGARVGLGNLLVWGALFVGTCQGEMVGSGSFEGGRGNRTGQRNRVHLAALSF